MQALGHLFANRIEQLGIALSQFAEFRVADLSHLALDFGAYPGSAVVWRGCHVEQAHLAEEVALIQVGNDHFAALIIFNQNGDRALDYVEQAVGLVARVYHCTACRKPASMAMGKECIEIFYFRCEGDRNH